MTEPIIVVSSDERLLAELSDTLNNQDYVAVLSWSPQGLQALGHSNVSQVLILDIDSVPVDNRLLRDLKRRNPGIHIVVISARPFHPELKEAMSSHIDICLSKPTDRDELSFWLNSIFRDRSRPVDGPHPQSETQANRIDRNSKCYK